MQAKSWTVHLPGGGATAPAAGKQPGAACALSLLPQLSAGAQSVNNAFHELPFFVSTLFYG